MGWHSITLQTLAANSFKKNRDRVFGKFEEQEITYMELDREANRLANAAISKGLHPGDRVGILVSNSLEFVVIYFGLLKAGLTVVALNDLLGEREASFILADSGVKMAFVGPLFMEKIVQLKPELPELKTVVAVHCEAPQGFTSWEDFKQGHPITDPSFNVGPEDEAIIIYTGGTTGIPKGVVHSQEGLVFNIAQHCMEFNWNENEKILLMTPLAHAAGLIMMVGMVKGATHVIEKWFNPVRALELIQNEKITLTMMVPTIIYVLIDMLKQQPFDVSSLTTILYGAAPITEKRLAEALEVFGPIMRQAYGQTECPNLITTLTPGDHLKAVDNPGILGSCGRPVHLASLVILDTEGNEAAVGQPGEIAIKSPCIMKGYNKKPEATKAAFNKDGWLMTGDMGRVDEEGYIYIVDRRKDMIISGGLNVYSVEVEEILRKHPKVQQAAVIGVPDDHWGEAVTAMIVAAEECTAEEIKEWCKDKMAKYMQPKNVHFCDSFPLTPIGKIDKVSLRAPFWQGKERAIH